MHRPGDKVKVTYLRKKKEHITTLTLRNEQGTTTNLETVDTESMGAALRALTDAEKNELGLKNGTRGQQHQSRKTPRCRHHKRELSSRK